MTPPIKLPSDDPIETPGGSLPYIPVVGRTQRAGIFVARKACYPMPLRGGPSPSQSQYWGLLDLRIPFPLSRGSAANIRVSRVVDGGAIPCRHLG